MNLIFFKVPEKITLKVPEETCKVIRILAGFPKKMSTIWSCRLTSYSQHLYTYTLTTYLNKHKKILFKEDLYNFLNFDHLDQLAKLFLRDPWLKQILQKNYFLQFSFFNSTGNAGHSS